MMTILCTVTEIVGTLTLAYLAYKILDFLHLHCIRTTDYNQYGAKQGAWALITGARAGIGKGFAEALAKKGFNLIMTARNASQLAEVAKDLETRFSIKTQCLNVDSEEDEAADKIAKGVRRMGVKLTVLVNNVGVNVDVVNVLSDTLDTDINKIINVNVTFTTMLTKLMIPIMACPDKRALIINLSSYSGRVPVPLLATYAASKAYNDFLSRSLSAEVKDKEKIDVVSLTPKFVVSEMSNIRNSTYQVPSALSFANSALNKVSYGYSLSPHWYHDLEQRIVQLLPESIVSEQAIKDMYKTRARQLQKKETASVKGTNTKR